MCNHKLSSLIHHGARRVSMDLALGSSQWCALNGVPMLQHHECAASFTTLVFEGDFWCVIISVSCTDS